MYFLRRFATDAQPAPSGGSPKRGRHVAIPRAPRGVRVLRAKGFDSREATVSWLNSS